MTIHAMAEIRPNSDDFDKVRSLLLDLVGSTRREDGVMVYDMFVAEDGKTLHIIEAWQDEASLRAHMRSPDFKRTLNDIGNLVAEPLKTFRMTPIGKLTREMP